MPAGFPTVTPGLYVAASSTYRALEGQRIVPTDAWSPFPEFRRRLQKTPRPPTEDDPCITSHKCGDHNQHTENNDRYEDASNEAALALDRKAEWNELVGDEAV